MVRKSMISSIGREGRVYIPKEISKQLDPPKKFNCFFESYIGELNGQSFIFYALSCITDSNEDFSSFTRKTGLSQIIACEEKMEMNKQGFISLSHSLLQILELYPSSKVKISGIFDNYFTIISKKNDELILEYLKQSRFYEQFL